MNKYRRSLRHSTRTSSRNLTSASANTVVPVKLRFVVNQGWLMGLSLLLMALTRGDSTKKTLRNFSHTPAYVQVKPQALTNQAKGHFFLGQPPANGTVLKYRFFWDHKIEHASLQSLPIRGNTQFTGLLALQTVGRTQDTWVIRASVDEAKTNTMRILDKEITPNMADLVGHNSYLMIDEKGRLTGFRFATEKPALFKNVIQNLVALALFYPAEDLKAAQWRTVERTTFGFAENEYIKVSDNPFKFGRKRTRYTEIFGLPSDIDITRLKQNIRSVAAFTFRPNGILQSAADAEVLIVTDETDKPQIGVGLGFKLELESSVESPSSESMPDLAALESRKPWDLAMDAEAVRKGLEQQVDGLTPEIFRERVWNYADLGQLSDEQRFFYRAVGLLKLRPELCQTLVTDFFHPMMTVKGRAFIVDLLIAAEHLEAQKSLVRVLSDPATKSLNYYTALYQRIGLLRVFEQPAIEFIANYFVEMNDADPKDTFQYINRMGSIGTLGAAAGTLIRTGNEVLGYAFNKKLVEGLEKAKETQLIESHILALGNTRLPLNAQYVLKYVNAPEVSTRKQVAYALGKFDLPEVRKALIGMLMDKHLDVQAAAIRGLGYLSLTRKEAELVIAAVISGGTSIGLDPYLITYFRQKKFSFDVAKPALDLMYRRNVEDEDVIYRLRTLEGELESYDQFAPEQ